MVGLAAVLVAVAVGVTRSPGTPAPALGTSPSPTASRTTGPSASPTVAASPSPTAAPTSTQLSANGRFVNAAIGYSIELTAPWRRSECFSGSFSRDDLTVVHDNFLTVRAYDEQAGDVGGIQHGHVEVRAEPNPDRLTPRQWLEAGKASREGVDPVDDTFAGKPALRLGVGDIERYLIAHDQWMVEVNGRPGYNNDTTREQRAALIASIRFLDPQELSAARAAATSSPQARTARQVADALAQAFAQKDLAALRGVIDPGCVDQGAYSAGVSTMDPERYLDRLRDGFARGLSVEVDPATLTSAPELGDRFMVVGSIWRDPGQPDARIDLVIQPEPYDSEHWVWNGTLANAPER